VLLLGGFAGLSVFQPPAGAAERNRWAAGRVARRRKAMKTKIIAPIVVLIAATLICFGYDRYCYSRDLYLRSLRTPLPNRWASLNRNYDAVSANVKRRFPKVVGTTQYTSENGYIMGFRVKHGTVSPSQAREIADYAYPKWVQIRIWSGMVPQDARACQVHVFDDWGIELVRW
jgi:hypothetical protein